MDTPRDEIRYGIGRSLATGREGGPVVQIDQSQLSRRRDNHVTAENIEARGGGGLMSQAFQACKIERVFPGLARIEPMKKSAVGDAIEFYLVAGPMGLQRRHVDPALREISHSSIEAFDRINPLHIRGYGGVDITSLQPDAAIEIERSQIGAFPCADQLRLRKRNTCFDHQCRQSIAMSI